MLTINVMTTYLRKVLRQRRYRANNRERLHESELERARRYRANNREKLNEKHKPPELEVWDFLA